MRIAELIAEQTIGTVGSTTGPTTPIQQVSQTQSTSSAPAGSNKDQQSNPDQEKFAKLLMPYGITDPTELNNASAALQVALKTPNQLKPDQQEILGKLVNPMLKNQNLASAIKLLATQKPQTPTPMGSPSSTPADIVK